MHQHLQHANHACKILFFELCEQFLAQQAGSFTLMIKLAKFVKIDLHPLGETEKKVIRRIKEVAWLCPS
jgi:hypothetical protein